MKKCILLACSIALLQAITVKAQPAQTTNKPERVNWFQDLGFGLFIHWNVDATLGAVISHSLSGSSDEYAFITLFRRGNYWLGN